MQRPEHGREGLDYLFVGEHPALPGAMVGNATGPLPCQRAKKYPLCASFARPCI
jgi:hypothetical protein